MSEDKKQLNKVAMKFAVAIVIFGVVYFGLYGVAYYQKSVREANTYGTPVSVDTGEISSYNVEGMTEEEIEDMIEEIHKQAEEDVK